MLGPGSGPDWLTWSFFAKDLLTENGSSQGHDLALPGLFVLGSLDSGTMRWPLQRLLHEGNQNNYFTEMCSGSEEGSYLRLIDFCITQL